MQNKMPDMTRNMAQNVTQERRQSTLAIPKVHRTYTARVSTYTKTMGLEEAVERTVEECSKNENN